MKSASTLTMIMALAVPQTATAQAARSATASQQAIAPDLARYTDEVLFGDIWRRPGLPPRDRSLLSVTALVVKGSFGPLERHIGRALDNGVKPREIVGLITHLAFYSGWPYASGATDVALKVFDQRGIDKAALNLPEPPLKPTSADDPYRNRSSRNWVPSRPNLPITDKVVFDDLWLRSDLAVRDRCLVTLGSITSGSMADLSHYGELCRANGLTGAEIGEVLTHLAFYAGWPNTITASRLLAPQAASAPPAAVPAARVALTVYKVDPNVSGEPSANFTGLIKATPQFALTGNEVIRSSAVTFRPGARTKWHSHPHGQMLVVTAGQGWVQSEGAAVQKVLPGDVIWTPPGVRHWHGATRTTSMTHVTASQRDETREVKWEEPVSEAEYVGPR